MKRRSVANDLSLLGQAFLRITTTAPPDLAGCSPARKPLARHPALAHATKARASAHRGRHSAAAHTPPAWPEPADDAARGGGSGDDHVRHRVWLHARHAHWPLRAQPGPAARRLRRDEQNPSTVRSPLSISTTALHDAIHRTLPVSPSALTATPRDREESPTRRPTHTHGSHMPTARLFFRCPTISAVMPMLILACLSTTGRRSDPPRPQSLVQASLPTVWCLPPPMTQRPRRFQAMG